MNHSRVAILGLLTSMLAMASVSTTVRADTSPAAPSKVGVVNLKLAYTSMQETKATQDRLKGLNDELQTMQTAHQDTLKALQAKMANSVKSDSDAHIKMMEDFDTQSLQFASDEKKMQIRMVREQNRQLKAAFDEIQAAVKDLAAKKGLDLVLVNSNTDLPENSGDIANSETLAGLIFNRSILYVSDKVDITADVVAELDAAYKAHGSGK
jgi:Skp family chaperone for outer membrane proteins